MSYNITIRVPFEGTDEERDQIAELLGIAPGAESAEEAKPKTKPKTKSAAKAKEPADAGDEAEAVKTAEGEEPDGDGPTREDVKNALQDYSALNERAAAVAILKKYAASVTELDPSDFQAVIDACQT